MNEDKRNIRAKMKTLTSSLSGNERKARSEDLCSLLISNDLWKNTDTILLYASLPDEIDTSYLILDALKRGKRVVLPTVKGNDLVLREFIQGKTSQGAFGIEEPGEDCGEVNAEEIGLAIIPGRAFSKDGQRLGRGKGYYDRLLPRLKCPLWGIAYSFQIVESLPCEKWDISVDKVFGC